MNHCRNKEYFVFTDVRQSSHWWPSMFVSIDYLSASDRERQMHSREFLRWRRESIDEWTSKQMGEIQWAIEVDGAFRLVVVFEERHRSLSWTEHRAVRARHNCDYFDDDCPHPTHRSFGRAWQSCPVYLYHCRAENRLTSWEGREAAAKTHENVVGLLGKYACLCIHVCSIFRMGGKDFEKVRKKSADVSLFVFIRAPKSVERSFLNQQ